MKFSDVISKFSDVDIAPLGDTRRSSLTKSERRELIAQLEAVEKRNERYFLLACGLLVVLFVVNLLVVLFDEDSRVWAVGVFGASAAGLFRWSMAIWREKHFAEITVRLAIAFDAPTVKSIVNVLNQPMGRVNAEEPVTKALQPE